jgi:hypothetical protein
MTDYNLSGVGGARYQFGNNRAVEENCLNISNNVCSQKLSSRECTPNAAEDKQELWDKLTFPTVQEWE